MENSSDQLASQLTKQYQMTPIKMAIAFAIVALSASAFLSSNSQSIAHRVAANGLAGSSIDQTVTGSVKQSATKRYVVRRSVLQSSPTATCMIFDDGTRQGDC